MVKYDPKGHGREKTEDAVWFNEVKPPSHLSDIVHRYLELRTGQPLSADYRFHALPDACVYIIFNQLDPEITGVTKLRTASEEFNLGKRFHYVNIRFFPGVWQLGNEAITFGPVEQPYAGRLPLIDISRRLVGCAFDAQQDILSELVEHLVDEKVVMANTVVQRIMRAHENINSVKDMADLAHVSPRQLQRILKKSTGFAPHDFIKVIRLQRALSSYESHSYADQAHFIRSFRSATGYTPGRYAKKFDV